LLACLGCRGACANPTGQWSGSAASFPLSRDSHSMRAHLPLGWRRIVNNHAWALVRLQARRRKFAPRLMNLRSAIPMLRHPFGTGAPLPKWARVLISGAKQKNTARWNALTPLCRSSNVASARRAMLGIPVSLVILPRVSHFFRLST